MMKKISWPSPPGLYSSFYAAVDDALMKQIPIVVAPNTVVHLSERIYHKLNAKTLKVIGCSDGCEDSRPLIVSSAHSLFQIGGRGATLIIENLRLRHTCFREHHKDIGAVVFSLNRSNTFIKDCELISDHGFGVWAVQRGKLKLSNCTVKSISRSGCVSFGLSSLSLEKSTVHDCKLHGVCSRGTTVLSIADSKIIDCGIRGVYAYHNVDFSMTDTVISGTKSCEHAAVDLWGCSLETSCRNTDSSATDSTDDRIDQGITIPAIDEGIVDSIDDETISPVLASVNPLFPASVMPPSLSSAVSPESSNGIDYLINEIDSSSSRSCSEDSSRRIIDAHNNGSSSAISIRSGNSDTNFRREVETSSVATNVRDVEQMYSILDIADESNVPASGSHISKNNMRSVQETLNVKLLNCKIVGNKGIGLRMRQGRDAGGSLITGSVTDCLLYDNEAGNVLKLNDESSHEDYSTENDNENSLSHRTHPDTDSAIPTDSINKNNKFINKSARTIVWEFERDDSSSSSSDWMRYDPISSKFLQRKYEVFLRSISKSALKKVDNTISLDSDSGSDDGNVKPKYCSKKILLPSPLSRYEVDFSSMQQTNGDTHYMRAVRRREE